MDSLPKRISFTHIAHQNLHSHESYSSGIHHVVYSQES